jgi:hypothetical protein
MEYVNQRGSFYDVPLTRMVADFSVTYPRPRITETSEACFDADVDRETL